MYEPNIALAQLQRQLPINTKYGKQAGRSATRTGSRLFGSGGISSGRLVFGNEVLDDECDPPSTTTIAAF